MTDWQAVAEELALGVGQHLFFIDGQDRGVLEVRDLEFEAASTHSSAP
jgi:protein involved in temperature-dependent protein secretion